MLRQRAFVEPDEAERQLGHDAGTASASVHGLRYQVKSLACEARRNSVSMEDR